MPRMGPTTFPVTKSKLNWCRADWLSFRRRVSDLLGTVVMAAQLGAVRSRPCEGEEAGLCTGDTEAQVSARKRGVVWSLRKTKWPRRTALTPPALF